MECSSADPTRKLINSVTLTLVPKPLMIAFVLSPFLTSHLLRFVVVVFTEEMR